jgi:hypothetical protein
VGKADAALVSPDVALDDDFFIEDGIDLRPLLSQLVSSELDVDRMDYLLRDAHFAGVSYGKFDLERMLRVLRPAPNQMVVKHPNRWRGSAPSEKAKNSWFQISICNRLKRRN